jgi:hypothetical protein
MNQLIIRRFHRGHAPLALLGGYPPPTTAPGPLSRPGGLNSRFQSSLLHLSGVPWARIGEHVGQRNLAVTANTYSHVLVSEDELDYEEMLR